MADDEDPLLHQAEKKVYAQCMLQLSERLDCVSWLVASSNFIKGDHFFLTELIFLQLRKALELIALSSLAANKDKYSAAHAKFYQHWKADKILVELAKVNPDFYPKPVKILVKKRDGGGQEVITYDYLMQGFLTKADFAHLYDRCSKALHTRNPFSRDDEAIQLEYTFPQWVERIRQLIRMHMIVLGGKPWQVEVPDGGTIRVRTVDPRPHKR